MAVDDPLPELRDQARNRWPGVLAALGVPCNHLTGKQSPCPVCGGRDRFRFDNLEGNGTWICNNCGAGDGARLLGLMHGWSFREVAAQVRAVVGGVEASRPGRRTDPERAAKLCRELWGRTVPAESTMAEAYLRSRGLEPPYPPTLRFCEAAPITGHASAHLPAMVARIDGPDGKGATLHRTYLENGRKADIPEPRRTMPGTLPDGAAIRLAPAGERLGVAEGIETALAAAALFRLPVWATVNSTMMEKFVPPAGVRELHVFGDNDLKFGGQAAAYRLAHRIACRGGAPAVALHIPGVPGQDWNDVFPGGGQRGRG